MISLRREEDPRLVLREAYGLSNSVSNAIARHLEEHTIDSFQVPEPNRILIEQIIGTGHPAYLITTCREGDSTLHWDISWQVLQNRPV